MITTHDAAAGSPQKSSGLFNRNLVLVATAYIAGIVGGYLWLGGDLVVCGAYAGLLLQLLALLYYYRLIGFFRISLLFVIAISGAFSFTAFSAPPENSILQYAGQPVYLEGTVIEEPLYYEDHSVYQLQVEAVETKSMRHSATGRVLVRIYNAGAAQFQFGERLRLRSTLVEPRGLRNPGGFDYRFYLRSQGIDALAYPNLAQVDSLGAGVVNPLANSAIALRSRFKDFISSAIPAPASELLIAILFGWREQLPEQVEENFRRAGAGHLMAISGLHVGLAAVLVLGLWRIFNLKGRLPLVAAIVLVFAYTYLTGMRPSALRAAIMFAMAMGAMLLDREKDLPAAVAFSALATLFFNPLLLFTVGFQLSYAATLALIYIYRPLDLLLAKLYVPALLRAPVAVTMAAQIGVLPLSLYYFHYLPTGALVFNLLLVPLTALVVGLGLAGVLTGLLLPIAGELLLWAARPLLELMLIVTGFSTLPGLYLAVKPPGLPALFGFYALLTALLLSYYRWEKARQEQGFLSYLQYLRAKTAGFIKPGQRLAASAALVLLSVAVIAVWAGILFPGRQLMTVTFIDVGQGASTLVETPCGAVILIDAGGEPAYSGSPGTVGEKVVLPLLRYKGISKIDLAVITHPHEDHFGGFIPLIGNIDIEQVLIAPVAGNSPYYNELLARMQDMGLAIEEGFAGQSWFCGDELRFELLGPPTGLIRGDSSLNNNSLVALLTYGEVKILLTGDSEEAAVQDLLARHPELKADLLQIPHHGGYLPSIGELLDTLQPKLALIQVGPNPFGHPHPDLIEAIEAGGIALYRSDQHGAVIFTTDGGGYQIETVTAVSR